MPIPLRLVVFIAGLTAACQEPWRLVTESGLEDTTVTFKNITSPGRRQTLVWAWHSPASEKWEAELSVSLVDGTSEGSFTYNGMRQGEKTHVHIPWKLNEKAFTSTSSNRKIFSNPWRIETYDGASLEFRSDKYGQWFFLVYDKYPIMKKIHQVKDDSESLADRPIERKKRSEMDGEEDDKGGEIPIQEAGVMECIYDFLFGEGDEMAGRDAGLFTRVRNWFKDMTCRIMGSCESGGPGSPVIPTVTFPPYNPDAEPATGSPPESAFNDILKRYI